MNAIQLLTTGNKVISTQQETIESLSQQCINMIHTLKDYEHTLTKTRRSRNEWMFIAIFYCLIIIYLLYVHN
jgi:t-SNARE complex subunit (syntaxin)